MEEIQYDDNTLYFTAYFNGAIGNIPPNEAVHLIKINGATNATIREDEVKKINLGYDIRNFKYGSAPSEIEQLAHEMTIRSKSNNFEVPIPNMPYVKSNGNLSNLYKSRGTNLSGKFRHL